MKKLRRSFIYTLGGLLLLTGAGCVIKQSAKSDISGRPPVGKDNNTLAETSAPAEIKVKNQSVTDGQVMIEATLSPTPVWVVIHQVINDVIKEVIGANLVSAGANTFFSVAVPPAKVTTELAAMLHVDKGQTGVYEETLDVPLLGEDGKPILIKFQAKETAESDAVKPEATVKEKSETKVEAKTSTGTAAVEFKAELKIDAAISSTTNVRTIKLTAKQWEFSPSTITTNRGDRVRLLITSNDVTHGFALPDFGVKGNLEPDKTTAIEFTADKTGTFVFFCSVYCGDGHQGMRGTLIVK